MRAEGSICAMSGVRTDHRTNNLLIIKYLLCLLQMLPSVRMTKPAFGAEVWETLYQSRYDPLFEYLTLELLSR